MIPAVPRTSLDIALRPRSAGTLAEALEILERVEAALPVTDGVHWFTRLYREATHDVAAALRSDDFADPVFLEGLGVSCVNAYLDALAASEHGTRAERAWRPLFARRHDRLVAPVQFASAGL